MPKFYGVKGRRIRRELAKEYLSWAEQQLTELSLCMIFLEREFHRHRREGKMWEFAVAIYRALPLLEVRIYLTVFVADAVDLWALDESLDWWIFPMKRQLYEHTRLLAQLLKRAFRGSGWWPWRERTVVGRRLRLDDKHLRKGPRGEISLRRPVVISPPILTKRMRRVLGERKLSCDLWWKREGKEQK